jgi:hypothetical protein
MKLQEGIIMNQTKKPEWVIMIFFFGDDTDERNARLLQKRRDSKINELLGKKEPKIVEEKA